MQAIKSISTSLDGTVGVKGFSFPKKAVFPIVIGLLAIVGILSPLFDLNAIHGLPTAKLYTQHLYFDGLSDAGGFYAASFCKHWYHKVPIAIGFALLSTLLLTMLVG